MYLLHSYKEAITLLDSEGRSYRIEPNEPWEVKPIQGTDIPGPLGQPPYKEFMIPAAKVADDLCKKAVHYGLVPVPEVRTTGGISFDLAAAAAESTRKRADAETAMLQQYVRGAKEDELAKLPIRPPSEPIIRILNARGLDLKRDFGVQPVGWTVSEGAVERDRQIAALEEQNRNQAKELSEMKEMLAMLLQDRDKKAKKEA